MYLGVGFPGRKAMKGIKRVSMVAATPAETMMIFRRRVILFFFEGEKYKDDNHAWDDKMVGTEYREAHPRDNQSGNTAGMVFFPKPVVGEDSSKHGGQHEVQSFEVEGEKRTDEAAQRCPNNPIGFIEPGNLEQVPSSVGSFRNLGSTSQGKGLARHSEDKEEFLPSQSFIFFEHREPIKQMSCIHHQYHQEGL